MIAVAVVVQRDLDIALAVGVGGVTGLIEELGGSLGIVLAVLPDVLGGIVDGGRHDGGSRHTGALEQGVDDVLAVDGQGDGATDLRVSEDRILRARDQEVGGELGAEQALLAGSGGKAVLGLAILLDALLDLAARDGSEVDGAGLELVERGVRVLLDGHVHAVEAGLLTVVILKAGQGDVLVVLPGLGHHERTIADGLLEERLGILISAGRHGGEAGVAADGREVGHGVGQGDLEGQLIDGLEAGELVGVAGVELGVTGNRGEVVADVGRGLHLGGSNALPAADEGLGVDGIAVVELHALTELEGVDATVLGDRGGLGGAAGNGGSGIPVPLHKAVEHVEDDRGALVLLSVIRIDERGLGEVEVHDLLAGSVAATVLAATAASEGCHR